MRGSVVEGMDLIGALCLVEIVRQPVYGPKLEMELGGLG